MNNPIRLNKRFTLKIYFFFFFISGFSGLIYESIWTHYLKLFLGHAAYSQSLVLIIFMGGMAIGAGIVGKHSIKMKNLLLIYAITEGIIGLLGIFFHPLFIHSTNFVYFSMIPHLNSALMIGIFKWLFAMLLILPQTILLGATFPLMSGGIIRSFPGTPGHSIAVLYFLNSLGAAAGILISGFFLVKIVGLPGTILTAGILNVLIALVVWLLCRDVNNIPKQDLAKVDNHHNPGLSISKKLVYLFFICAGLTGTASFLYEIGWIRMLSIVLGSSSHAFELMVSAFILGLAVGSYLIKKKVDHLINPVKTLGIIQLVMGFFALVTLSVYGKTFDFMLYIIKALAKTDQGYGLFNLLSHGICMVVMLPATICAGMTLPIITYYLIAKGYGEGSIGKIYAANTLGSIFGVFFGVQLIMPILGLRSLIIIGASLDILLGLILLWNILSRGKRIHWLFAASISIAAVVLSVCWLKLDPVKMSSAVYRRGEINPEKEILFHKDGKTASVDLFRLPDNLLALSSNGRVEAISYPLIPPPSDSTNILAAALPMAFHDRLKTAANIGMGCGLTPHVLLTDPGIETVDIIEIESAIVEGAKGFGKRVSNTFKDPRSHIYIEDAKTFFTSRRKKYDLIISFPSCPWVTGVSGLFSKEFYRLINNYINDDGFFVQWITLYEMDIVLVASIIKALSPNFKDYLIYITNDSNIMIIAGKQVFKHEPDEKIFALTGLRGELNRIGIFNKQDLQLRKLGSKEIFDPLINSYGIPANSDYFPVLEIGAAKAMYLSSNVTELISLRCFPAPLIETLAGDFKPTNSLFSTKPMFTKPAYKAKQGLAILRYFNSLTDQEAEPAVPLDKDSLQTVRNILSILYQVKPGKLQESWLTHLHDLAKLTLPYLSAQEMNVIWTTIEKSPNYDDLTDEIKNRVALYKAVGSRNFEKIIEVSSLLLPGGMITDSQTNNYLLTVSMWAHIILKRYNEAVILWGRYANRVKPPIELRLLVTYLLSLYSP